MKIYGIIFIIFFMLFASSFGTPLRFNFGKPSFLTLRLRRREFEIKKANTSVYIGYRAALVVNGSNAIVKKFVGSISQQFPHFQFGRNLESIEFMGRLSKPSIVRFSQSVNFFKNRLLSPPPTPPPIA